MNKERQYHHCTTTILCLSICLSECMNISICVVCFDHIDH